MEKCINCDERCFGNETQSHCVKWTGPDIECVGIKKGQYLNDAQVALAEKLCEVLERRVDLNCLYSNTCDSCEKSVEIPVAVQALIDKVCGLCSSDISCDGNMFCLGEGSISSQAAELSGRNFSYGNTVNGNSSNVFFDFADATSALPSGFTLGNTRAVLTGTKKNGKTIINESEGTRVSFPVETDRYPLNLTLSVDVNTPGGTVRLNKVVNIPTAGVFNGNDTFNVQDFGAPNARVTDQKSFNERVAAQVCQNKQKAESLERLEVEGCDNIKYPTTNLKDIVSINASSVCGHDKRIGDVENVSVVVPAKGDCKEETTEMGLQEAILQMSQQISDLTGTVTALQTENAALSQGLRDTASQCSSCASGNCGESNGTNTVNNDNVTTVTSGGGFSPCTTGNCGGTR